MSIHRDSLMTGDMLCWEGDSVFSRAISAGQYLSGLHYHKITHIGMFINGTDIDDYFPHITGRRLVFESTTMNTVKDVLTDKIVRGVSLVDIDERMASTAGEKILVRPVNVPHRAKMQKLLGAFIVSILGKPYERNIPQLLASALPFSTGINGEDIKSMFCSETYVEAMEFAYVFEESKQDSDAICPAELADLKGIHLCDGVLFGDLLDLT